MNCYIQDIVATVRGEVKNVVALGGHHKCWLGGGRGVLGPIHNFWSKIKT